MSKPPENDNQGDPGDSMAEIKEQSGRGIRYCRAWIKQQLADGTMIEGVSNRRDIRGRRIQIAVYRPA
jgi:hypothetical protein